MALMDLTILEGPILELGTGTAPIVETPLSYWITIQDAVEYSVQVGSISCQLVLNGKSSLSCVLLNPTVAPLAGQTIKFIDRGKLMFGGIIQTVTLNADQAETVKFYSLDCAGMESILERHLVKSSYTNRTVATLIRFVMSDANLTADGFSLGHIDEGAPLLLLADADYVRASEYLRDIATAGGGSIEVGPEKEINYRKIELRDAPFPLINAEPEEVSTIDDLDNYCNRMTVRVTGSGGATANYTRQDPVEIAKRAAVEGGTGIYEAFEKVTHPISNDPVELGRFGISLAFILMLSRGRASHVISAKLRRNLLDVGQLLDVNLPGMNAVGEYQISRMTITDEEGQILFAIEATYTSRRQLNLDSLLKIVQQAKATIVLPSDNFANSVEFTTPGANTWNVPGTGTVQVECDVYGAGAGGGGGDTGLGGLLYTGGRGGNGGKAVSFREYAAGTVLSYFIGTGGSGGAARNNGSNGTNSYVSSPTESRVAEGFGGGLGGGHAWQDWPIYSWTGQQAPTGQHGSGTPDFVFVGEGSTGGPGGTGENSGTVGSNGRIVFRY